MLLGCFTWKSIFSYILHTKWQFLSFEGVLTLWRHNEVIHYGLYLFSYQWKEEVDNYTLVANLGLYDIQYCGKYIWQKCTGELG